MTKRSFKNALLFDGIQNAFNVNIWILDYACQFCEGNFTHLDRPHILHSLSVSVLPVISLVGGLGVADQQNGIHEVPVLLHWTKQEV